MHVLQRGKRQIFCIIHASSVIKQKYAVVLDHSTQVFASRSYNSVLDFVVETAAPRTTISFLGNIDGSCWYP